MNFNIKKKYFIVAAYLYMVIPVMIFMLTWLKLYVGIPMAVTLAGGLFFIYKNEKCSRDFSNRGTKIK